VSVKIDWGALGEVFLVSFGAAVGVIVLFARLSSSRWVTSGQQARRSAPLSVLTRCGRSSTAYGVNGSGQVVGSNPYGPLSQIRAYDSLGKIGFVSGGTLFIVPIQSPDSPTTRIQGNIVGYDLSPDGSEVVVTASCFIENASQIDPYVVVFDAATHKIKMIQPMGLYPFHSVKRYRDGLFLPPNLPVMWFSDRELGGVIEVSVKTHQVLASLKTGRAPFHLSYGPNELLYVANHDDATFSVIDPLKLEVLETIHTAPDPHGIVVTVAP